MEISVTDKQVKVVWGNYIGTCDIDEVVNVFKNSADIQEQKRHAVNLWEMFKVKKQQQSRPRVSTSSILEGCVSVMKKCNDYDIESEIDELLGADPYTPFY